MSTQKSDAATCPAPAVLRDFLNDALSDEDAVPVQAHVDACPACQQSLGELVGGLPEPLVEFGLHGARHGSDDTVRSSRSARDESPAEIPLVPGYEVLKELGRGGMGVVYQARQLRPDRIVALKMLLAGRHAGPKERARFLREAEAAAHLQHPNIVALYEAGQHGDLPYFTLEFIEGGTLAHQLLSGPLEAHAAARLVEQVARGMHYAHERGIVHRDLKPANILLQRAGSDSAISSTIVEPQPAIPKISDFGLAKNLADAAALTSTGAIFGTPSYMAPEQASGDIKRVGAAADVYALGAVLYGLAPFPRPDPCGHRVASAAERPVASLVAAARRAARSGHHLSQMPREGAEPTLYQRPGPGG
jgi:serine/threonine protein kinase